MLLSLISDSIKKIGFKKNNKVVYTVITGDYDDLKIPEYVNEDWDYICFTDTDIKSDFWQIRNIHEFELDPVRKSRKYKILPHNYLSEYDYSIYIDGSFVITGDMNEYINKYAKTNPMLCLTHPERNCIYDEADVCLSLKKDSENIIITQIEKYLVEKYPKNNGLIAGGIMFRKHNDPSVIEVMEDWNEEVLNYSRRDQLSFNYICWKKDFEYDICDLSCWGNEYFRGIPHKTHINNNDCNIND